MISRFLWVLVCMVGLGTGTGQAQPTPSIEDFVGLPAYGTVTASRNGRYLAATIPVNGRMNLAVIELESMTRRTLTTYSDFDVVEVRWVGNDRLLFKLGRAESPTGSDDIEGGGLFMVTRDGKPPVRLSETVPDARRGNKGYRSLEFVRTVAGTDTEVLALGNLRDAESYDIYRLNVETGQTVLLTEGRPERTFRYVLDRTRVPRIAVAALKDSLTFVVYYRRSERAAWEELLRYDGTRPGIVYPMFFEADNQTLIVSTNIGRDSMAVYRYDPNARKLLERVFEHPRFDIGADASGGTRAAGEVSIDSTTDEVLGYTLYAERPQTVWNTEADRRIQRVVDRLLPDTFNVISRLRGNLYLVSARSDRWPRTWHIFDEGAGTLEDLVASRPALMQDKLAELLPFVLKTRDGLDIPSYYVLPKNRKPGERLPTVVHIHGGPAVRADYWGQFSYGIREAQLLASRGYAVVLPNFRITPGFGNRVYYAGIGKLGREMIDDHEDAARWAVKEGIADPGRICISGASYGGYATLMSLARFPSTFKCGVAGLVVSDLPLLLTSRAGDIPTSTYGVAFWRELIGARTIGEIPPVLSPVNLADRIKQPLLMYAGVEDIRTPLEQTERMVEALQRAGNPPTALIIKQGEGHGFGRPENTVELYGAVLRFLDEQIGPRRAQ
jgi:dipeptidyl aminopeptidase/acylaminoacyl peptidase